MDAEENKLDLQEDGKSQGPNSSAKGKFGYIIKHENRDSVASIMDGLRIEYDDSGPMCYVITNGSYIVAVCRTMNLASAIYELVLEMKNKKQNFLF
jgi:hypothetical protein